MRAIDKIVATKQAVGVRTSFSYELFRLAKNALLKEMDGVEWDKQILMEKRSMIIAKSMIDKFCDFLNSGFGSITKHDKPIGDEYGRMMLEDRLMVIRRKGSDTLEVFCPDRDKLQEIESVWAAYLAQEIREDVDAVKRLEEFEKREEKEDDD